MRAYALQVAGSVERIPASVQDNLEEEALTIYTDGSMFGSPRRGGIGIRFAWIDQNGGEETYDETLPATMNATNNEMELEAPSEALTSSCADEFRWTASRFARS